MNYPKVRIVVIARNEEKMLPGCLAADKERGRANRPGPKILQLDNG